MQIDSVPMMNHEKIIAITLPALLACVHLTAQGQTIPIVALGTPYAKVRVALQKEGWTPVHQTPDPHETHSRELRKRGWTEVQICAGTGRAPCIFVWQNRQGKLLEVVTTGDEPHFGAFR